MSSESIGIKIADGTFYPVLEQDFQGRKRLVVTTVRDNQSNVQIDFYRSATSSVEEGGYIGSLLIENVEPSPKGEPEIEVLVGLDGSGNLNAEAQDRRTGEKQGLSVSRASLAEDETYAVPDVELEETVDAELGRSGELITGDTYPIEQEDRRRTYMVRKRSPLLLILFLILCIVVIGGAAWYVYTYFTREPAPQALPREAPAVAAQPAPSPPGAAAAPAAPAAAAQPAPALPPAAAAAPPAAAAAAEDGVWYTIRWGDTLWDISTAYYRNPWFYPRIARHPLNNVRNPDRILAGFKLFIPTRQAKLARLALLACGALTLLAVPRCRSLEIWGHAPEEMRRRLETGDHAFLRDVDFGRHAVDEAVQLGDGAPYLLALAFQSLGLEARAVELFRLQVAQGDSPWDTLALAPLLDALNRGGDYANAARLAREHAAFAGRDGDLVRKALVESLYWAREDQAALEALAAAFPSGRSPARPEIDAELALFRAVASSRLSVEGWPDLYLRLCLDHPPSTVHVRLSQLVARDESIRSALPAPVRSLLEAKASIAAGQQARALGPFEAAVPALNGGIPEGLLREGGQAYLAAGEPLRGARFLAQLAGSLDGAARLAAQEAAGRLYRAAGDGGEAWGLLSEVAASSPNPAQRDRASWMLADMAAKAAPRKGVAQVARSLATWSNAAYFDDLVDDLATRLLADNDREGLRQLFDAVAGLEIPARIRLYYILRRLGDRTLPDASPILSGSSATVSEDYYRLLLDAQPRPGASPTAGARPGAARNGELDFLLARLIDFGLHERATALVRGEPRGVSRAARLAASRRLVERGRYRDAIILAGSGFPWDEPKREVALVGYPRAFEREIRELAGREKLETRLLFAVTREESAFDAGIVSSAGAVGLTQLLSSTAAEEAARLRLRDYDLRSARDNLSIGTHYLGRLVRLQESVPFGLAAYNAGPSRLRQWKQQFAHLPPDLLIEAIPFEETRHYVRKVLVSAAAYGALYERLPAERTVEMFYGPRAGLDR